MRDVGHPFLHSGEAAASLAAAPLVPTLPDDDPSTSFFKPSSPSIAALKAFSSAFSCSLISLSAAFLCSIISSYFALLSASSAFSSASFFFSFSCSHGSWHLKFFSKSSLFSDLF